MDFEALKNVFVDTLSCDPAQVTLAASLADDLGADSLDAVELNMALEEAFGVAIPDEMLPEMKTVQNIFDYLAAHTA
ncbi:MAG: acyl carrier protein [Gemmiger sp.]|nr:acyl carrier protein [Gemmiger sp.]